MSLNETINIIRNMEELLKEYEVYKGRLNSVKGDQILVKNLNEQFVKKIKQATLYKEWEYD